MEGYTLGQPYGVGCTEQSTVDGIPPAAGSSFSVPLAGFDRFRLVFAAFALTTDANAANRYVTVEYLGGDGVAIEADGAALTFPANTAAQRYLGSVNRGTSEHAANTDVFFPLCGIWMPAGATVTVNVAGVQAGDTLTNIRLTFDRWLAESQRPGAELENVGD